MNSFCATPQDPQGPPEDATYHLGHRVHNILAGKVSGESFETIGRQDKETHTKFQRSGGQTSGNR